MDTEAFLGVGQNLVLIPVVRNAARKRYHLAQRFDLVFQRLPLAVREPARFSMEFLDELRSLFGDDLDRVGGEQLVIAERGGDRAAMFIVFEARFDVVAAVASRFEAVN